MALETLENKIRYNDVIFFLALIPVINALNYYLTYTNITFNAHTVVTFLIDTFDGYIAWWGFRTVVVYLDQKLPYEAGPWKRIVIQLVFSSLVGLVIIIVLTELVNLVATRTPVPSSFYKYDLFIFLIWFIVLNAVYIGLYYYHAMRRLEQLRRDEKKVRMDGFSVKDGKQRTILSFTEIAGFYVDDDYTALVTASGKRYLLDRSLDNIEPTLPGELFFRLNRQFLICRTMIKGFSRIENGKLNVTLGPSSHFPESVLVSRTKGPDFKIWYAAR